MISLLLLAAVTASTHITAQDCEFSELKSAALDARGADLAVEAGAGSLRIEGKAGLTEVRVRGKICASSKDLLEGVELIAERKGTTVSIETDFPEERRFRNNEYVRMDLTIEVPAGMDADVSDGSGEAWIYNVGSLTLVDGSGELDIRDVKSADIEDGSGELHVRNVRGNVEVRDGSGELTIEGIDGTATIRDGSGSIEVVGVGGDVEVRSDGSGSISVRDVKGGFRVLNDGSGDIRHTGVAGKVRLPNRS
jgi:hypothetical protein